MEMKQTIFDHYRFEDVIRVQAKNMELKEKIAKIKCGYGITVINYNGSTSFGTMTIFQPKMGDKEEIAAWKELLLYATSLVDI